MDRDTSLDALLRHIDELAQTGTLSKSKAGGWKTACRSLGSCLPPADRNDVTRIDPQTAAEAYKAAHNPADKTFREYRGRLIAALESFKRALGPTEKSAPQTGSSPVPATPQKTPSHTLSIPLRSDFIAQLTIPFNITSKETEAITEILSALAKLH